MARHAEVRALLRHDGVVPIGTSRHTELVHRAVAGAATGARTAHAGAQLRPQMRERWNWHTRRLNGQPVAELLSDLAIPWSQDVTSLVTGVSPEVLDSVRPLAREVFVAAARSTTGRVPAAAERAAAALAKRLSSEGLGDVQSVVALTHTLPCLLVNSWRLLWEQPEASATVRACAGADHSVRPLHALTGAGTVLSVLIGVLLNELLRRAGPARAVFRECLAPISLYGLQLPPGARLVLLLDEANHDPAVFPDPHRCDPTRRRRRQLSLGDGVHRCPGYNVVRGALHMAVEGWLDLRSRWEPDSAPDPPSDAPWQGGFAIPTPVPLRVRPIVPVPAH